MVIMLTRGKGLKIDVIASTFLFSCFKDISKQTSASLPRNMGTTVQNNENVSFSEDSDLKFGFSAELENLVNVTMKKDNET